MSNKKRGFGRGNAPARCTIILDSSKLVYVADCTILLWCSTELQINTKAILLCEDNCRIIWVEWQAVIVSAVINHDNVGALVIGTGI